MSSSVRADAVECLSNLERQDAGLPALGVGGHAFVLDAHSAVMNPAEWGALAVRLYQTYGADRIVAETNFGADMVELTIRTVRDADDKPIGVNVPFKALNAARGKAAREEPAAALYEQGRVHHVGTFPELEDELCSWEPNSGMRSPNRLDWLVWALTELMLGDAPGTNILEWMRQEVATKERKAAG